MNNILDSIRQFLSSARPLAPGMYHFQAPPEDPRNFRLHLRIDPNGSGLLVVNAATVLHLNQTAAEYAYHLVKQTPENEMVRQMSSRYRTQREKIREDYRSLVERIETLINTPDLDPETFLDFERLTPFSGEMSAPLRLDCALTYRLPEGSDPAAAPTRRVERELSTEEWQSILDKAWQAGILHIVFTGGEPTLRQDLPALIAHAEKNGQVSGLLSDGLRLADANYLDVLLKTGLDHLMIIFQPERDEAWQALDYVLKADLFVAVHLTVTPLNSTAIPSLLKRLTESGVKTISLSATDQALGEHLAAARDKASELGLSLVWDLPVPYSTLHPVAYEIQENLNLSGAGRAWLYVEPDGDVLPTQGVNRVLGNWLADSWEKIWQQARAQ